MRCKNWRKTMLARTDADAAEAAKPSPVADHACFGSMHGSSAERHLIGQQGHAVEHKKRRHSWWPTVSIHAMSLLLVLKPFYNHEDICMQPHVPSLLNHTVLHHGYGHSPFCPRNQKEHEKTSAFEKHHHEKLETWKSMHCHFNTTIHNWRFQLGFPARFGATHRAMTWCGEIKNSQHIKEENVGLLIRTTKCIQTPRIIVFKQRRVS